MILQLAELTLVFHCTADYLYEDCKSNLLKRYGVVMNMNDVPVMKKEEVLDLLDSSDAVIVNVLASQAYDKLHIRNSVSVPYDRLENGELDDAGKEKKIIIYCASYSCGASRKAAALLREKGIDAYAYEGGIKEWAESGYPTDGYLTPGEYLEG